jgi:ubiquinone/menaquinone biosynthesis C-methylase UbiE
VFPCIAQDTAVSQSIRNLNDKKKDITAMSDSQEPRQHEYSSTYIVQDRQSEKELKRLAIQDQLTTGAMGGVLPEQANPSAFHRTLDIGCGPGSWVIQTAQMYPTMSLDGIDISKPMIEHARAQAAVHQVADRVSFHVMDALLILEFPPNSFDLVNLRFGASFVRTWEWPKLLSEMQRVLRPDGIVRITDVELAHQSSSPALLQLLEMLISAFFRAGNYFEQAPSGITSHLARILTKYGCQSVQTKAYTLEYRAGTPEWQAFYDDMALAFQTLRPFLQRRGCLSEDYDAIYQQALIEMQQPDFHATWNYLTAWGNRP